MSPTPKETNDAPENIAMQIAERKPPAGPLQLSKQFQPLTDEQAWSLAERIKNSNIIPKDFMGKPENIFIAILMGREVGLPAIQAVQNIMVVNGRPSMWGDSLPALVYASGKVAKFEEEFDEKTNTAICTVRRVGDTKDHVQKFSWADAVKAGYDKKSGPWQTVPRRMMQMRARAFGLRDKFADVLKGLGMVEEAMDYIDVTADSKIEMPREVAQSIDKAAAYTAQESVVTAGAPAASEAESTKPSAKQHPQVLAAKAKFEAEFKVSPQTIDAYLDKNNLIEFGVVYPRLIALWKELKNGKTTLEKEFGDLDSNDAITPTEFQ